MARVKEGLEGIRIGKRKINKIRKKKE